MQETDAYGREGYKADRNEPEEDTSLYPHTWAPWAGGWGFRSHLGYGGGPEGEDGDTPGEDDDSWLDEGAYSLLIIAGVVLFFFPEPATSLVGVLLMLLGAAGWLADAMM